MKDAVCTLMNVRNATQCGIHACSCRFSAAANCGQGCTSPMKEYIARTHCKIARPLRAVLGRAGWGGGTCRIAEAGAVQPSRITWSFGHLGLAKRGACSSSVGPKHGGVATDPPPQIGCVGPSVGQISYPPRPPAPPLAPLLQAFAPPPPAALRPNAALRPKPHGAWHPARPYRHLSHSQLRAVWCGQGATALCCCLAVTCCSEPGAAVFIFYPRDSNTQRLHVMCHGL